VPGKKNMGVAPGVKKPRLKDTNCAMFCCSACLCFSRLCLLRAPRTFFNDAGSEIHLSPTDLASPLPTQVELEKFVNNGFGKTESGLGFPRS
jgi:hypothetical protein